MSKEELQRLFLTFPQVITERKQIIVEMDKYPTRKGEGTIEIISETADGFMCSKTHQKHPYTYLFNTKEYQSNEYEIIIKE